MSASPRYPFSDLTPEQLQKFIDAARQERANTARILLKALIRWPGTIARAWPPRLRQAQAWPARHVPALSLKVYH